MAKGSLKNIHRLIGVATTQAPINEQFLLDLTSGIERLDQASGRKPSKSYKPSSMVCIRNMYFQKTGTDDDGERSSSQLIGMGQSGSSRHDSLQSTIAKLKDIGVDCEYIDVADYVEANQLTHLTIVSKQGNETKLFHKGLCISFLCDGIIKYKGKYYILEIKTETMHKFIGRQDVAEEHHIQGITYSLCTGINDVMFLYENRDSCDKKAYLFHVSDKQKFEVVNRIEECDSYVNKLIPPPKPTDIPKKTCTYCKYKKACKKAGA